MLPRAVVEAGERADAILAQLAAGNTAGQTAPAPEPQPVVQEAAPVEPQVQEPAIAPEPAPQAPAVSDEWEKKYRLLAGKYSAEVPRYAEEVRELKAQVRELTEKLSAPAPQPDVTPLGQLSPAEVVEKYGEDFAAAVGAIALQVSEQKTGKLRDELMPKVDVATNSAARSARAQFMTDLSQAVPDWQVIDQDERFTAFLDGVDPLSGRSRRDFFNDADQRNDASRIAAFFKTFRASTTPVTQPAENASLAAQIAPSSARTNDAPPGKKLWTRAEIAGFYAQAKQGRISQKDFDRIESDLFAAQRENRVVA